MDINPTPDDAHELRRLALMLRQSASQTDDPDYSAMFLSGARALEAQAGRCVSIREVLDAAKRGPLA